MVRILIYCVLATISIVTFCARTSVESRKDEKTTEAPAPKIDLDMKKEASMKSSDEYDLLGVMKDCNETFRIEICKFLFISFFFFFKRINVS